MTNVFIWSAGDDTGGNAAAIVRAAERHGSEGLRVAAMRRSNNYIDYPLILGFDPDLARQLYEHADVVHVKEEIHHLESFLGHPVQKPVVLHHHGSILRDRPGNAQKAHRRGFTQLASTLDLTLIHPAIRWMPNAAPVDWFELFGSQYALGEQAPFTISHTPTARHIKGTDTFLREAERAGVRAVVTERVPWVNSLVAKARSHAYYDQMLLGIGSAAVEAWSMHRPVIAGVRDAAVRAHMIATWGELPFVEARNADELARAIALVRDPDYAGLMGARGHAHVRRYHDERLVIARLEQIWESLL